VRSSLVKGARLTRSPKYEGNVQDSPLQSAVWVGEDLGLAY